MNRFATAAVSLMVAVVGTSAVPGTAIGQIRSCSSLASTSLPSTIIMSAEQVAGPLTIEGGESITGLPPFCRVTARSSPAVHFEVWLPVDDWNGKFQGVGNGANAGSIGYSAMAEAVRRGYATAGTDTGHSTTNARDAQWAMGHPGLVEDFGYRALHITTQHAKHIVAEFYGTSPVHSYFVGCSTGGRQGLMEAQRFPNDYDGIVAGAPAANWTRFEVGGHLWVVTALNKDPESYVPASKLPTLQDAVNAACDANDGIRDGILNDPRTCQFDPALLTCGEGRDDDSCLTPKQVQAVRDIWAGARNSFGRIYPGYMPGAEAAGGWASYMTGTGPRTGNHWAQADNVFKYMVFEDPEWDFRTFDFDEDLAFSERKLGGMLDAFDPDLTAFKENGGKLLLYHGWNDPSISPLNTIDYYEQVDAASGGDTEHFARLFMVPGMLHCRGGPGPSQFDMLRELERWVEDGQAPERIVASHVDAEGYVDRTRPLCAYPEQTVYTGSGRTDDEANFACR
jgi:feruloyl esterase